MGGFVEVPPDHSVSLTLPQYTAVVPSQGCDGVAEDGECPEGEYCDVDGDGICDYEDNCLRVATRFVDALDGDGYGNACDADFDDSGLVDSSDSSRSTSLWGKTPGEPEYDPRVDLDGNGGSAWEGQAGA